MELKNINGAKINNLLKNSTTVEKTGEIIAEHSSKKGKLLKKASLAAAALALVGGAGGCICMEGYYYNPYPVTPCGPVYVAPPVFVEPCPPVFIAPYPTIMWGCW